MREVSFFLMIPDKYETGIINLFHTSLLASRSYEIRIRPKLSSMYEYPLNTILWRIVNGHQTHVTKYAKV